MESSEDGIQSSIIGLQGMGREKGGLRRGVGEPLGGDSRQRNISEATPKLGYLSL